MPTSKALWQRERKAKLLAAGLCIYCTKGGVTPGMTACPACRERNKARAAEYKRRHPERGKLHNNQRYQRWKADGLCYRCGSPPAPGRKQCTRCLAADRTRRRELVSAGICADCGEKATIRPGRWLCNGCYRRMNLRAEIRTRNRREAGLCIKCASPARPGKATCRPCFDRDREHRMCRKERRLANGLCVTCGKLPLVSGNTRCTGCILYQLGSVHPFDVSPSRAARGLRELFDKQQGRCIYTGRPISIGVDAELDHVVPRAKGGLTDFGNLQWVCGAVNRMKHDLSEEEFLTIVGDVARQMRL